MSVLESLPLLHWLMPKTTSDASPNSQLRRQPRVDEPTDLILPALSDNRLPMARRPRPGENLLTLLRAGHYAQTIDDEQQLLDSLLGDAVDTLDAQRAAIALLDETGKRLRIVARANGGLTSPDEIALSRRLAARALVRNQSQLWQLADHGPEFVATASIRKGMMASALCIVLKASGKTLGVLHVDRGPLQGPFTDDDLRLGEAIGSHISAGMERARLRRHQRQLKQAALQALARAINVRDAYTGEHTSRVTDFSLLLANELGLDDADLELLRAGTPLHDIGKIGVPDEILRKPGKLTSDEFEIMKSHTIHGERMIDGLESTDGIKPIIRSHHERWDGRGYPDALVGEKIPKLARLVAVCDAFDAMTSDRPYRPGMSADAAFEEIRRGVGTQFDPVMANAFLRIREAIVTRMEHSSDALPVRPSAVDAGRAL